MSLRKMLSNIRARAGYGIGVIDAVAKEDTSKELPFEKLHREEQVRLVRELAAQVNADMPKASLRARLWEGMKRCKGGMHPKVLEAALRRQSDGSQAQDDDREQADS